MPINFTTTPATAPAPISGPTAYLSTSAARTLAATLPDMAVFLAKDDASQAALLLLASIDVDRRKRYQGRKYDPQQEHEFPRVASGRWPVGSVAIVDPYTPVGITDAGISNMVWDWDATANNGAGAAVVPPLVLIAVLYQANHNAQPKYAKRLEAIRSGVTSQAIGSASETYAAITAIAAASDGLCERASQILDKYRLSSGPIR